MASKLHPTSEPVTVDSATIDELVERISDLVEAGRDADIQSLIDQHPKFADRLRSLLPAIEAIAAVEDLPAEDDAATGVPHRQLGDYRLLREIGRGGMGVVYEAEQISLGRLVALKVLPLAATLNAQQLERFKNEARAAATLKHPHIVGVYSVGVERGVHYYAMELVEGQSLAQTIAELQSAEQGPPADVVDQQAATAAMADLSTVRTKSPQQYYRQMAGLMADVADALEYAHNQGVLHRDIKPANLMIDGNSHIWITDFGLARLENEAGVTLTGDLLGTLRYMSPEQASGKPALVDYRTDIHALGASLFELIALRPAFDCEERGELLHRIAEAAPPRLRQVDARVPADLETIVQKALEKDPADRYQSAGDMAADLRAFAHDQSITAKPPSLATRAQRWVRHHVAFVTTALGLLLAATIGMGGSLAVINHLRAKTALALNESEQSLRFARQAVDDMYMGIATDWLEGDLELTPTKRQFLDKAQRIYQQLAEQAGDDPPSQWEAGTAYARVGQIQHKLGQYRQAEVAYELSLEVQQELLDVLGASPQRQLQIADTYRQLGQLHADQEQLSRAAANGNEALKLLTVLNKDHPNVDEYRAVLATCQLDNAGLIYRQGDRAAAEQLSRTAKETYETLLATNRDSFDYRLGSAHSGTLLARLLRCEGRLEEAEQIARRAEIGSNAYMNEAFDSAEYTRVRIAAMVEYADLLYATDRVAEALEYLDRARQLALQSTPGGVTPTTLMTQTMSRTAEWTRYAEPEAFRRFLEIDIRRGRLLGTLGRPYEAQQTLADSIRAASVLKIGPRPLRFGIVEATGRAVLAEVLRDQNNPEFAAIATSSARQWQLLTRTQPDTTTCISGVYSTSDFEGFLSQFPELRSTVSSTEVLPEPSKFNEGLAVMGVANGVSWYRGGSAADALMFLDDFAAADSGADSYAWYYLAMVYHELDRTDEAQAMLRQANSWMEANKPDNAELATLRDEATNLLATARQPSVHPGAQSDTLSGGEEALPDSTQAEAR